MITDPQSWVTTRQLAAMAGITAGTLRGYLNRGQSQAPQHEEYSADGRKLWSWETAAAFADRKKRHPYRRRRGTRPVEYRLEFSRDESAWECMESTGLCFEGNVTSLCCEGNVATFGPDVLATLRGLPDEVEGCVDEYNRAWFGGDPWFVEVV